jgi:hypothetical protein
MTAAAALQVRLLGVGCSDEPVMRFCALQGRPQRSQLIQRRFHMRPPGGVSSLVASAAASAS